jgi:hypothetical protein
MARKAKGSKGGKPRTIVPRSFGNDLDPEPITIDILTPTEGAKRELALKADGEISRLVEAGMPRDQARALAWTTVPIRECVTGVRNYVDPDDVPITTAAELLEHGEDEVVIETVAEILGAHELSDAEKKTSVEPSACMPAATTP